MAQTKSRNLKKRDHLERDHRCEMENPHAFRNNWPKKKARGNRQRRLEEKRLINGVSDDAGSNVRAVQRKSPIRKSFVMPLAEWIANRFAK